MNTYNETIKIMEKYKIKADKALGQNFLINDEIINKIIETANINSNDLVIEIGPGLGVLTNLLLEKSNNVIAVELDKRMITILQDRFKENENLQIINEDILKVNLKELIENKKKIEGSKVKIVANLPYYISTPIIMKLLEQYKIIDEIVVMVQKEVAERLTAKTGTRLAGSITYGVEYYSKAYSEVLVPKESFIPRPKVESEVIKLVLIKNIEENSQFEEKLFSIIKTGFMQRRKTLANALVNNKVIDNREKLREIFNKLNIDENVRAENLALEQFKNITKLMYELN